MASFWPEPEPNRKLRRHVLYGAPKLHLRHRFGKTPWILGGPTARDAFTQRDVLIRLWRRRERERRETEERERRERREGAR